MTNQNDSDDHFIQSFYKLLVYLDIDPSRIALNYISDGENPASGRLAIALPDTKTGFNLDGDTIAPLQDDDWFVTPVTIKQLELFHNLFRNVESVAIEDKRRRMLDTTKQVSKQENMLLDELIKRHLPDPDRNFRLNRDDGKELTTPDFTWPDLKIAFFVDGLWWHLGREDKERLDALKEVAQNDARGFSDANQSRFENDLRIRSKMTAKGWIVLSCTDRDLNNYRGIQEQADIIESVIENVQREQKAYAKANRDESDDDDFDPLSLLQDGDDS